MDPEPRSIDFHADASSRDSRIAGAFGAAC